ncbi:MAG: preprotein translocase subunit SecG [Pseudomonadota bacterium]
MENFQNVLLIVHLIIAVFLIGVVLLQRSEGGALGIGGGGGGLVTSRGAGSALTKITWVLAGAFIATSLILTIMAAQQSASRSVLDRVDAPIEGGDGELPALPLPSAESDGTLAPDLERLLTPLPATGGEGEASGDGAAAPAIPSIPPPAAD